MRRLLAVVTTLALAVALSSTSAQAAQAGGDTFEAPEPGDERVPDEWIVALQPFARANEAAALAQAGGGEAGRRFEHVFPGFVFRGPQVAAERLARHPRIRKVSPNLVVEADAQTEPTGTSRIQAPAARDAGNAGEGVTVAVLDTGIDLDHPDLDANISGGLGANCVDDDESPDDDNGHGTHVAGTVAASDDGAGVVGVAPEATLVPVKVLDRNGKGSYSSIICGVDHVTEHAGSIDVANMSLSADDDPGRCDDGSMREAICASNDAGVVYIVAAGNGDENASERSPANYGDDVITVSALDDRDGRPGGDRFASFSNYGSGVDLIAPGVNILSTGRGGGTKTLSGTSMASPHVAGAVALALADGATAGNVLVRLQSTGECPNGAVAGTDRTCSGTGSWSGDSEARPEPLVNALRAAGEEEGTDPGPGEPGDEDPVVTITDPDDGDRVDGRVTIVAEASDAEDATDDLTVEYQIDGGLWTTMDHRSKKNDFKARWDSEDVSDADHTITVRATDRSGGVATASVVVRVGA